MWHIYVLRCSDGSLYVGMTGSLERRLSEHKRAAVMWTKPRLPVELVYQETCRTRVAARKREKYLKSGWGKQWLSNKLSSS
ncbi:MAG: GIY-YIG nuclease family protein [Planctomycetota bacterium]